jgi:uncharacterized protein
MTANKTIQRNWNVIAQRALACLPMLAVAILCFASGAARTQTSAPDIARTARETRPTNSTLEEEWRTKVNANTIAVVAGSPNETYLEIAHDFAVVLNDDNLRILPIVGMGGAQNIRDVLYLRGIDVGITSSHMLRYFASTGELSANLSQRLAYIAKLFVEEMHVVVGPDIKSIEDLIGKNVNFSDAGSSTQIMARDVFGLLSIQVHEVNINQADAIAKIRSGEIAGTVLFSGKPVGLFSHISRDDNLHLLAISFTPTLENTYAPAELESEAYPGLIPQGQTVHTIGVDAVLITNNWPKTNEKYRRAAKFVEAFFSKFSDFRKSPRHPKWLQVNLAADLPGWQRFPAAQEWLERANQMKTTQVQGQFEQFLSGVQRPGTPPLPDEAKQQLFRRFLEWSARQQQ